MLFSNIIVAILPGLIPSFLIFPCDKFEFEIENKYWYIDLDDITVHYEIVAEGDILSQGNIKKLGIKPGKISPSATIS